MPRTTVDQASAASVVGGWQQWAVTARVLAAYPAGDERLRRAQQRRHGVTSQQLTMQPREAASDSRSSS